MAAVAPTREPRLGRQGGDPDLGIKAPIAGNREQVAADQADAPVAHPADRTQVVRHQELAQLRVARILHREVVRTENVVQPSEPSGVVGWRRAVVVADRLGALDGLAGLVGVVRKEIGVRPMEALIPDALADRPVHQAVYREPLPSAILRDGEAEIGTRIAWPPDLRIRDVLRVAAK